MNNLYSMYQNFMQNPMGFFTQNKINVPKNMMNDPNAIIDFLMNSGTVNQQTYNMAQQMFRQYYKR